MKTLGESQLKNFTLDAPTGSVYRFEGEDFKKKKVCLSRIATPIFTWLLCRVKGSLSG